MNEPLSEARLVVTGRDVAIVRKGELVSVLSKPGQGYLSFVVDLPHMLGELLNLTEASGTFAHGVALNSVTVAKKKPKSEAAMNRRRRRR